MAWLTFLMALVTVLIVVLRYAFSEGAIMLQESVIYMHSLVFMLAIPYALRHDRHVRVDLVYARLAPRTRTWVDLVGHLIFLLPVCGLILYTSVSYVGSSWRVLEGSPEVGGIPAIFLLKTLIPIMAATLLTQGLAEIARAVLVLGGRGSDPAEPAR